MSILQDERLDNFINLLKIIRKNKKDILELFKSQGMFNQLFEFVEANLKRIQPEKKKSEKKNAKSVGLECLGRDGVMLGQGGVILGYDITSG
ncbi:unnamed protein product [Meloidogyne enterolobii]|uniref:Uncharacterized protein n=1 Tax=Meloidogyne enterolobii TaxID=390850 RepID=A0ACB1AN95_MELEN